jgi:hypothetical protein
MEYTKLEVQTYKEGVLVESRWFTTKLFPWQTDEIEAYLYRKKPKLKRVNFTYEASKGDYFEGRLILNGEK